MLQFVFLSHALKQVKLSKLFQLYHKKCISYLHLKANMMIENMDLSVDPCDDFYHFTCGGYIKNARLTESKSSKTLFNDLAEKLSISVGG